MLSSYFKAVTKTTEVIQTLVSVIKHCCLTLLHGLGISYLKFEHRFSQMWAGLMMGMEDS